MYKRALFETMQRRVLEPRKFLQVIVGPRQIGKTTLLNQLVEAKLIYTESHSAEAIPAVDGDWLDAVWRQTRANMERSGETEGLLIIDEIQNITNWSGIVKKNWDEDSKSRLALKVILSGSSRLLLQNGLNESLMGRFELNYLGHWSYSEMKQVFGFSPEQYIWFGGYPAAAELINDENRFKNYLRGSIIEPSISRDILMLTTVDKPALLRQLFELGSSYSAQILSFNKMLGQLQDAGNTTTLARYAGLLDQAGLLAGLDEYSQKPIKTRLSSPKLQVHNTALLSGQSQRRFEDVVADPVYYGRLVESAVGAHLLNLVRNNTNLELYYWRDRGVEVDFVLRYGDRVLAIEVKSKLSEPAPQNLAIFRERFPSSDSLLIGEAGLKWQDFLTMGIEDIFK